MAKVVVVTGASAGVGRATVEEFAKHGYDVALLARDPDRLERAAAELRSAHGVRAIAIPTDVADAEAVEAAANQAESDLGPIDVWVNVAMATVFAPVSKLTYQEVERGTRVTYLGQVHGMMVALSRMRLRNHGTIVNVGSALAYRSVPLQSVYCGAKAAIRGFTEFPPIRNHSRQTGSPSHNGRSPGSEYAAIRLGVEQDGEEGETRCADL